ncbi:MAG: glycosyltransferase [Aphanizomenon flos-aquae LD13]|jgi:GT2 family glycosyltransferase|uniref:Glycosyltransferase n=1 Tax=Aphanizomenon flos-aquae LD13 TaxID=1710894 RepID=A0A1B7W005_APHFL|nr:glycosyltransferase family 2 protein [Aphanizomenon flos-aquae UKL13-PB]OBQ26609.1 MAG: glycosyltransferase [Aphanizomenon flos-aquae LD13]HCQ23224.1 glycosyltransferase family 2 protein [Anabaena sp. UBA12330]
MNRQLTNSVSIILVNYNGADVLIDCLNSLEKFIPKDNCEIIVVDNNSQDNSVDIINNKFPNIKLIKLPKNVGFGTGNNAGAKVAKGEFLFLLNTDTILTNNIFPHLIELMSENPDVGIIGPKLLFPDGSFQISFSPEIGIKGEFAARKLHKDAENKSNLHIIEKDFQDIKEVDIVVGAAFFIRTDLFNLLGGFDEKFFMYFEESDLCQRVRNKGYKILYTPYISLIHIRGHSVNKISNKMAVEYRRSQIYYYHKHRPMWEILMLKIYLLFKFLFEYLKTSNPYSWKIIKLIFID